MKTFQKLLLASLLSFVPGLLLAQVPQIISYQGRIVTGGTNFNGSGQFKFALVRGGGAPSLWSNDGTSVNGSEPAAAVSIPVVNGLYSVLLGDATLPNMTAIPASVFGVTADVRLRVWFNDGVTGIQQLSPDQRIGAVGYAMFSADVPDGAITSAKLANGAVTAGKIANDAIGAIQIAPGAVNSSDIANLSILGEDIANNSITGQQLANPLSLGDPATAGQLDLFRTTAGTPGISLIGSGSRISLFGTNGIERTRLTSGPDGRYGELRLFDNINANNGALLTAGNDTGGSLSLYNSNGSTRVFLSGSSAGSSLALYQNDGGTGVFLDGDAAGAGLMDVRNTNGSTLLRLAADQGGRIESAGTVSVMSGIGGEVYASLGKNGSGGGAVRTLDELGNTTTFLASQATGSGGLLHVHMGDSIWPGVAVDGDDGNSGQILIKRANDRTGIELDGYNGLTSEISLFHTNGLEMVEIIASEGGTTGGQILMRNVSGANTIQLDSDASGNGSGYIRLYKGDGSVGLTLEGDASGEGKITTQVLQITGGADLSENFDIKPAQDELKPGMIVCIDPDEPGRLITSTRAYDRTVAGIVSGAGGVKPGMLMGQAGTMADGKHPVALTGRVYCMVDADAGAIKPGDLITTSDTPGHGMKVQDHGQAQGAIIGKAMSPLSKGKGLVLVLVSLQ